MRASRFINEAQIRAAARFLITDLRNCIVAFVVLLSMTIGLFGQTPSPEPDEKVKPALLAFQEAAALYKQQTQESVAAAAVKFGEARSIFQRLGDKKGEGSCLTWMAAAKAKIGAQGEAIANLKEALKVYIDLADRAAEADIHFSMGHIYVGLKDSKSALAEFETALSVFTSIDAKSDQIDTLKQIAKIAVDEGNPAKAVSLNERALTIARSSGDKKQEAEVLANIGSLHLIAKDFQKAITTFEELIAMSRREKLDNYEGEGLALLLTANRTKGDAPGMLAALDRMLKFAQAHSDHTGEASTLNSIAEVHLSVGDLDAAAKSADDARKIAANEHDKKLEGVATLYTGIAQARKGDQANAIVTLNKAYELLQGSGEFQKLALSRMMIGAIYGKLGEKKLALEASIEAFTGAKAFGIVDVEIEAANNIGAILLEMGDHAKALEYFQQVLPLARESGNKEAEARLNLNIGNTLRHAGENPKALQYLAEAEEAFKSLGDKTTAIKAAINRGGVYLDLGENEKALGVYTEATLLLIESMAEHPNEETMAINTELFATLLNNHGRAFEELGAPRKALDYYQQSLPLLRDMKDKDREAITLTNIADIYVELGEKEKAIEALDAALALVKTTGNVGQEATVLNSYGALYSDIGQTEKAIEYYSRSLFLLKYYPDPRKEATTLGNLLTVYGKAKRPRAAAFYGKLAVIKLQSLRSNIQALDRQTQKTYLAKIESTYRLLAELLMNDGRLEEAQQVLNALKDQQSFDLESADATQLKTLDLTPHETDLAAKLEASAKRSVAGTTEAKDADGVAAASAFARVVSEIDTEMSGVAGASDRVGSIADAVDMRAVIADMEKQTRYRAAAVYLLVGRDSLNALIVTGDGTQTVTAPISRGALNAKVKTFWGLLQSDRYDPTALGKELYDIVFKPIESKLPAGTASILWSLDGNLRYVPMAALYDGKQYLVQRYNNIIFTRADRERLTRPVSARWTVSAFGSANEHDVEVEGATKHFSALPGVTAEMNLLVTQSKRRGIFDGVVLQDEKFTRAGMLDALKSKRPLTHISTHFSFTPGDEAASFLLLGDGTLFTLAEIKKQKDMFAGVELLTLSACNTAAQQADANGREVDAFFELAQRLGAQSVMATLWPVADNSTPWLMRQFYDLKINKHENKAEALRNAQLALLTGSATAVRSATRTDASQIKIVVADIVDEKTKTRADEFIIAKKDAKPFVADPKRPFAHPYYWSPFVLIGNWR